LNIARRIVDSQTPGYDQIGQVWLPLPHALMLPLVRFDAWWRSGLAGTVPSGLCFVLAGSFLFAAVRRLFGTVPAAAAAALFALNPNVLYLQSTPLTEPVFAAALLSLLYFTVRFRETQGLASVAAAGIAASAAALTRYEGWFLLPFVALYFFFTARRRWTAALLFCAIAGLGPLYWLAHNWWLTGDALDFYRGPWSARAIQGNKPYPGKNDWGAAWFYYRNAVQLCAGTVLALLSLAGVLAALGKRAFWPLALLALPGAFYIWSLHSSGTPIFLPTLWPHSYYNSRYGLAVLPLLALTSAALVALTPKSTKTVLAVLLVASASGFWIFHPRPSAWVTWEESRVNSEARRAWTRQAADYLGPRYVPGSGIFTSFGDLTGIYREAGIPLRETFTGDNGLPWDAAVKRPHLFLWQEWGMAMAGDAVDHALASAPALYTLEETISVSGAPEIRIYLRTGASVSRPLPHGLAFGPGSNAHSKPDPQGTP
jgi:hypothetical protein